MANYVQSADLNVQNGLFVATMSFLPGLNLLSGENGTLKTKVLHALKTGGVRSHDPTSPCRRQAVSPKRNAQRRAYQQVYDQFRRDKKSLDTVINERNINDTAFEDYPALGDLFYVVNDDLCKDGGDQIERMKKAASEFNSVIRRIFPHYELIAEWSKATGTPAIELLKNRITRVPLEGLSLGEQEILSLAMNIFSSRHRYEVFLIDEPEVHLNWHLEEKLFEFLDDLCDEHGNQMIVVTHSRVVFKQRFFPKTQFLCWNDQGKVSCGKDITPEQRRRIAGDAIEIIQLGSFTRPTFFVEDHHHVTVIEELAAALGANVATSECRNKTNVRSLYRLSKMEGGWQGSYFLEDGDNEGNPFPSEPHFFHLEKYCIEAYLFDVAIAARVCAVSEDEIKTMILDAVRANRQKIFKRNKFFEFLVDHLALEHLTPANLAKLDAAEIIETYLSRIGKDFRQYAKEYIHECQTQGRLAVVFPKQLVEVLQDMQAQNEDLEVDAGELAGVES